MSDLYDPKKHRIVDDETRVLVESAYRTGQRAKQKEIVEWLRQHRGVLLKPQELADEIERWEVLP